MAKTSSDGFLAAFKKGLNEARRQRKTDDILEFIRNNWRLFCSSKARMDSLFEEMHQQGGCSVDVIADMLGLPEGVLFKKVKTTDVADLFLHTKTSALFKLFQKKRDLAGPGVRGLLIFFVAGESTVVVTDMAEVRTAPGLVHLSVPSEDTGTKIEVFRAEDAPLRLPLLFDHRED